VKISSMGTAKLRIVTHLDYDFSVHNRFLSILRKVRVD